jgi:hypothetical protein
MVKLSTTLPLGDLTSVAIAAIGNSMNARKKFLRFILKNYFRPL